MRRPSGIVALDSNGLLIAAIVIIGLVGLGFVVVGGRGTTGKGRAGGIGAVVDQSIGMHIVRSLSGQAPEAPEEDVAPAVVLTADEVAYRIGIPGADEPERAEGAGMRRGPMAGAAVAANRGTAAATAARGADPAVAAAAAAPRRRLLRDAGAALLGLAAVALIAILVVPGVGGQGPSKTFLSVTRAQSTSTPRPTATPTEGPSLAQVETPAPTAMPVATPAPTAAPSPTPTGVTPARQANPRPTPRATPTRHRPDTDLDAQAHAQADAEGHAQADTYSSAASRGHRRELCIRVEHRLFHRVRFDGCDLVPLEL